ncbi:hypothetical protein ACU686_01945 [Yinghuangia aomiensis]
MPSCSPPETRARPSSPRHDFENGCITHAEQSIDDPFDAGRRRNACSAALLVEGRRATSEHSGWEPWTPVEFRSVRSAIYRIVTTAVEPGNALFLGPRRGPASPTRRTASCSISTSTCVGPSCMYAAGAVDVVGRPQCFFAAERITWEVLPVGSAPAARGGQPTADG